jgi:hypothetical protein
MKYNSFLVLLLFSVTACNSFKSKNDIAINNLKGPIAKLTTTTSDAVEKFGEVMKGKLTFNSILDFNKNGYITRKEQTSIYGDSIPSSHFITTRTFNDLNQCISYQGTDDKDKFNGKMKFDSDGMMIEEDHYNNGKFSGRNKFSYNEKGLIKEINNYDASGKLGYKEKFTQNEDGLANRIVEYDSTGKEDYIQTLTYDDNKQIISNKITGKYGSTTAYKYSRIDNQGNWLTQIEYRNGKLYQITERKIQYY